MDRFVAHDIRASRNGTLCIDSRPQTVKIPHMQITPFTPHPYETISHHVFPKPIGEEVYAQWNTKLAREEALVTERIAYEVGGVPVSGVRVMPALEPSLRGSASDRGNLPQDDATPHEIATHPSDARNDDASYPLIIFNRGGSGSYGMITTLQIVYLLHPMAKFWGGAIVLGSNYRGNDTEAALDERLDEFGGADVADVLALIEEGKKMPQWDGKNIFMAGWSRGGMMAALAMKQGAELTAAAAIGGAFDLKDMLEKRPGMRDTYERRIGITSQEKLEQDMRERSAIHWPEAISAPFQLQHGDADEQVSVEGAKLLAEKLEAIGAPHELILHAGGDHFLNRKREEVLAHIERWFRNYKT